MEQIPAVMVTFVLSTIVVLVKFFPDMEKGMDTRTLSTEISKNCGNFWIMEDWLLLFWNTNYELWKFLLKYLAYL